MTGLRPGVIERVERLARLPRDGEPPPVLEPYSDRLYASTGPLAWLDDVTGWSLAKLCGSIGSMFEAVEALVRDTPAGPGWSSVLDLDRCPSAWLPWLAQLVGVTIPAGFSDAQARAWIASTDGFRRGTAAALRAATQRHLTGSQTVLLQERVGGDAYALTVFTITGETPDPAVTLADILSQKPAGLVLTYTTGVANDYAATLARFASYDALRAGTADYSHLLGGQ